MFEPVMNLELGEAEGLLAVADGVVLSGQWQSSSSELLADLQPGQGLSPYAASLSVAGSRRGGSR